MAFPMTTGLVFNIQRYSLHDGPGIRSTVFLKGCPLCCAWCHNPESISPRREIVVVESRCVFCGECREACPFGESYPGEGPISARGDSCTFCGACVEACPTGARQMIGQERTVAEVVAEVARDRVFYEDSGGGVTLSGGEPLAQPEFATELLTGLQEAGIHTALDTAGFGATAKLLAAAKRSDLVMFDLKTFDEERHRRLTGVSNRSILENLRALDAVHPNFWIRVPIVPGYTDDRGDLQRMAGFLSTLQHATLVNLLPFHRTALLKYERLGRVHALEGTATPSPEMMESAASVFRDTGLPVKVGG